MPLTDRARKVIIFAPERPDGSAMSTWILGISCSG